MKSTTRVPQELLESLFPESADPQSHETGSEYLEMLREGVSSNDDNRNCESHGDCESRGDCEACDACGGCPTPFACYLEANAELPPPPNSVQFDYMIRHDPSFREFVAEHLLPAVFGKLLDALVQASAQYDNALP